MTDIIISISLYIIVAILLGFTFGWFIAKAIFKEKFEDQVEALSKNYDANKSSIDSQSQEQNKELAELKDTIRSLKSQHEKEVDAFLEERIDITMKYKELLEKVSA
jgi:flagellar motility protein MotE (MotC chaperone)